MSDSESDDDAPDIPAALSESEWSGRAVISRPSATFELTDEDDDSGVLLRILHRGSVVEFNDANELATIIALANEALRRFDDPRAITREIVGDLRSAVGNVEMIADQIEPNDADVAAIVRDRAGKLSEFADALESYLPPEKR